MDDIKPGQLELLIHALCEISQLGRRNVMSGFGCSTIALNALNTFAELDHKTGRITVDMPTLVDIIEEKAL